MHNFSVFFQSSILLPIPIPLSTFYIHPNLLSSFQSQVSFQPRIHPHSNLSSSFKPSILINVPSQFQTFTLIPIFNPTSNPYSPFHLLSSFQLPPSFQPSILTPTFHPHSNLPSSFQLPSSVNLPSQFQTFILIPTFHPKFNLKSSFQPWIPSRSILQRPYEDNHSMLVSPHVLKISYRVRISIYEQKEVTKYIWW